MSCDELTYEQCLNLINELIMKYEGLKKELRTLYNETPLVPYSDPRHTIDGIEHTIDVLLVFIDESKADVRARKFFTCRVNNIKNMPMLSINWSKYDQ
jgi:hypothetical protein